MPARPDLPVPSATRPDWRGWIALAWAIAWGTAYAFTAIEARAPQVAAWLRQGIASTSPGPPLDASHRSRSPAGPDGR